MHNVNRASCTRTSQILYAEEEAGGRGRMQMQDAEAGGRSRQKVEVQGEGSRQSNFGISFLGAMLRKLVNFKRGKYVHMVAFFWHHLLGAMLRKLAIFKVENTFTW